jgi:hypothetical protein
MRVMSGVVVQGKVGVKESLPEGTTVKVLVGGEEEWELDEESTRELLQSVADSEHEEGISLEQLFEEMRALR